MQHKQTNTFTVNNLKDWCFVLLPVFHLLRWFICVVSCAGGLSV